MNTIQKIITCFLLWVSSHAHAQQNTITPDLSNIQDSKVWNTHNRDVTYDNTVYLNSQPGDGLVWLKDLIFENGTIEVDIKGKDVQGQSFVGIAFHGVNDSTYDAVYFRPFNFKSRERKNHAVQYISHPQYSWFKLREEQPEKYENPVNPVPEPEEWFHATIIVDNPSVKVFVNNANEPSLEVNKLSSRKEGWIGFWVGNNSEGNFKNLKIIPETP